MCGGNTECVVDIMDAWTTTCHDALCVQDSAVGLDLDLDQFWCICGKIPHGRNECATNLGLCLLRVNVFFMQGLITGVWCHGRRGHIGGLCGTKAALACVICAFCCSSAVFVLQRSECRVQHIWNLLEACVVCTGRDEWVNGGTAVTVVTWLLGSV
jgi:hypothetical protein